MNVLRAITGWVPRLALAGLALAGLALVGCAQPASTTPNQDPPRAQAVRPSVASTTPPPDARPRASHDDGSPPPASLPPLAEQTSAPLVLSPYVRVDREAGFVELDGTVAIDVHGATPKVYLEVLVTSPNTREHEALVVTAAKAQDVHAGLLLLGLEPGSPASFAWSTPTPDSAPTLVGTPATGPDVRVLVQAEGGDGGWLPIVSWMQSERGEANSPDSFVFAGSTFRRAGGREIYAADIEGTIVGLTAFGTETIAFGPLHNPDAATEQPHFVARTTIPHQGTRVRVRVGR